MASLPVRKTLTAIALARGVADSISDSYPAGPPKTPAGFLDRVRRECAACFRFWPDALTAREIGRIHDVMCSMEGRVQNGDKAEAVAMTSLAVMLADDRVAEVPDGKRREALAGLRRALLRLHRYYDRRLDHWAAYDAAAATTREVDRKIQLHEL